MCEHQDENDLLKTSRLNITFKQEPIIQTQEKIIALSERLLEKSMFNNMKTFGNPAFNV